MSWPTTFGTCTCSGPLLTSSCTCEPFGTDAPSAGLALITWPFGTVSECCTLVSANSFAFFSARVAWLAVSPANGGTVVVPGPFDTWSVTVEFLSTFVPASGVWASTTPTVSALSLRCTTTVKPRRSRSTVAASSCLPTSLGTVTRTFCRSS